MKSLNEASAVDKRNRAVLESWGVWPNVTVSVSRRQRTSLTRQPVIGLHRFEDTELGVLMELEVGHGERKFTAIQA